MAPVLTLMEIAPNAPSPGPAPLDTADPFATSAARPSWLGLLFVTWLTVAAAMGLWVLRRGRLVAAMIRASVEAPPAVQELLDSCRRQLGIKRTIAARCARIGSPAIGGVWRPIILLPPGLAEDLDGSKMRSVLLHELAHYKRGDLWVNHAQIILQILYWYNPLLWLANACIRRVREQAVDEMVLVEMGERAPEYPATLLHVAKLGLGRHITAMGLMGILEPGCGLTQRIKHIMNRPLPQTARIGARGFAAVLLLALVALPMASRSKADLVAPSVAAENQKADAGLAKDTLVLVIPKDGAITLRNEKVTLEELRKKLAEAVRENPQMTLTIMIDQMPTAVNVIMRVFHAADQAGVLKAGHVNIYVGRLDDRRISLATSRWLTRQKPQVLRKPRT